jgi:anaerobic ribonucleoside-triphosphate reductase
MVLLRPRNGPGSAIQLSVSSSQSQDSIRGENMGVLSLKCPRAENVSVLFEIIEEKTERCALKFVAADFQAIMT